MSWVNILKKNDKEFQKDIPKKKVKEPAIIVHDNYLKNHEDEFDLLYSSKIIDIKLEFKEYIENLCLPFLDKNKKFNDISYNINDYIKYNCTNLLKLKNNIEEENEEYLKELEETDEVDNYDNYDN